MVSGVKAIVSDLLCRQVILLRMAQGIYPLPARLQRLAILPDVVLRMNCKGGPSPDTHKHLEPFLLSILKDLSNLYPELTFVSFAPHQGCSTFRRVVGLDSTHVWKVSP